MTMNNEISGIFISLTEQESSIIFQFLENEGYESSAGGVKNYLLDCMYSELEENEKTGNETNKEKNKSEIYDKLKQFISENPETVNFYKNAVGGLIKNIFYGNKKTG